MLPIIIVGAGPKAAALAAKRASLLACGYQCPEIVILEKDVIGAHWTGQHGFTSGAQRLGTPPEKDVGFPYYYTPIFGPEVIKHTFANFSWHSFQIFAPDPESSLPCYYGEWIDRGRPHPEHRRWAEYLSWVIKISNARVITGVANGISHSQEGWTVTYRAEGGLTQSILGSAVVLTGPGTNKKPSFEIPAHPHVLYGDDFWKHRHKRFDADHLEEEPIVIVGGGETAAAIASYLIDTVTPRKIPILVITRGGALYSRGEGYYENRMFTDHELWAELREDVRREVIKRGDRGVFSVDVVRKISLSSGVEHRSMTVSRAQVNQEDNRNIDIFDDDGNSITCQRLIFALGFDQFWFTSLLDADLTQYFDDNKKKQAAEIQIQRDLSVKIDGLPAGLHLPMLAGTAQGPGFPNLSCLGLLADVILKSYAKEPITVAST